MRGGLREGPPLARAAFAACLLALLVPTFLLALHVGKVSAQRLIHPHELSRMEGVFVRHARRAAEGLPLYTEPSAEWVPLLYTPLHHVAAGALLRLPRPEPLHDFLVVRLPSVLGVACALLLGMALVRRSGGPAGLALLPPVLAAAAYATVAGFYDQARPDNLMVSLLVGSVAALAWGRGRLHVTLFVALSLLAFLAKQSSLVFSVLFLAGAALVDRRAAAAAALGTAAGTALLVGAGHLLTEGWLTTYVFEVAAYHGRKWGALGDAIVTIYAGELVLPSLAVLLALAALAFHGRGALSVGGRGAFALDGRDALGPEAGAEGTGDAADPAAGAAATGRARVRALALAATVASGGFSAASILQPFAMRNVFVLHALMGAIFVPIALGWALEALPRAARARALAAACVVLGVGVLSGLRDVEPLRPWSLHVQRFEAVRDALRAYGPPERIWVTLHGAFWEDPQAQEYVFGGALYDLVGGYFGPEPTGHPVPADLRERIAAQAFDAVVVADWDEGLQDLIDEHYERDPETPELRIPAFSGFSPSREEVWIPRRSVARTP